MAIDEVLKVDLAFTDDFQASPGGDFDTVSGSTNLRYALLHRLITVPGSLVHRPNYGVGVPSFQGAPMTLAVRQQLAKRIAAQFAREPRVLEVSAVSVTSEDGTPETVTIKVSVVAAGVGAVTLEYTSNEVFV